MIRERKLRAVGLAAMMGTACQFGGCQFNDVTTTVTLSGEELIVTLIRGAILTPIDQFITESVNDFFRDEEE